MKVCMGMRLQGGCEKPRRRKKSEIKWNICWELTKQELCDAIVLTFIALQLFLAF